MKINFTHRKKSFFHSSFWDTSPARTSGRAGSVSLLLFFPQTQRAMDSTPVLAAGLGKGCFTAVLGPATNPQSQVGSLDV